MFKNHIFGCIQSFISSLTFLVLILFLNPYSAGATDQMVSCENATTVLPNTTLRSVQTTSHLYAIEVPGPGFVTWDVVVSGLAKTEAMIHLLSLFCEQTNGHRSQNTLIEQTASRLVLHTNAPTSFVVRITPQDPRKPLGEYRLMTGFVAAESTPLSNSLFGEEEDDEESDDEIELEPRLPGIVPVEQRALGITAFNPGTAQQLGGEEEDDEESDDEIELEPRIPGLPSPQQGPRGAMQATPPTRQCQLGETDDHGDRFGCATALNLGDKATGEIWNQWGDDHDLFSFTLTEPQTLQLTATGPTDTLGGLYDRSGHRLAADDDGGLHKGFRMVKTLGPGLYFIRIEGSYGAEGPYSFFLETLSTK